MSLLLIPLVASTLYNYMQTTFDMFGQTVNVQVPNTKIVRTSQQTYAQLGALRIQKATLGEMKKPVPPALRW